MNNAAMKQSSSVAKIQTKICMDNHGFERIFSSAVIW